MLKRFVFSDDMSASEKITIEYFEHCVRKADSRKLTLLLRFSTGYNILMKHNEAHHVEPSDMSEFCRRPIGQTCKKCDSYIGLLDIARKDLNISGKNCFCAQIMS